MKLRLVGLFGIGLVALLVSACGGGGGASSVTPSSSSSTSTLSYSVTAGQSLTLLPPAVGGNTATINFGLPLAFSGSATVGLMASSSLPASLPALSAGRQPLAFRNTADYNYTSQSFYQITSVPSIGFSVAPTWNVTIGSPIANASYFIAFYDPTIPGWNVGYESGAPTTTPSPNATNVAYTFTPQPYNSPLNLSANPATFALVAISGATPTPGPTVAPFVLPPGATNVASDGGFETEGAAGSYGASSSPWYACNNPNPAASETPNPKYSGDPTSSIQNLVVHGGSWAGLAGSTTGEPNGGVGICQKVTVPASPSFLQFWVLAGGNDASKYIHQEAYLVGSSGTAVALTLPNSAYTCTGLTVPSGAPTPLGSAKNNCTGTALTPGWVEENIPASQFSQLAGQTATLYFGAYGGAYPSGGTNTKGYAVYMYVDDVVMY